MAVESIKSAQVHVRISPNLKRAVKVYCATLGTTEQALIEGLLEAELARRAPTLWPPKTAPKRKRGRV